MSVCLYFYCSLSIVLCLSVCLYFYCSLSIVLCLSVYLFIVLSIVLFYRIHICSLYLSIDLSINHFYVIPFLWPAAGHSVCTSLVNVCELYSWLRPDSQPDCTLCWVSDNIRDDFSLWFVLSNAVSVCRSIYLSIYLSISRFVLHSLSM